MTTPPCARQPDLWFSTAAEAVAEAKRICVACPLADACAQAACDLNPEYGIWAGRTPQERGRPRRVPYVPGRHVTGNDINVAAALKARGLNYVEIARQLGVSYNALLKAAERARKAAAA